MKVFLLSALVVIGVAYAASMVLDETWQSTAATSFSRDSSVRLGDPGNNLVGADWPSAS
jgi:LPS O-antigen subunit length determinant protein (WzzB/FepE family)